MKSAVITISDLGIILSADLSFDTPIKIIYSKRLHVLDFIKQFFYRVYNTLLKVKSIIFSSDFTFLVPIIQA